MLFAKLSTKNQQTILYILIVVLCVIFYFNILKPQKKYYDLHHVNIHGTYLLEPFEIPKFTLTDNHNHRFSNDDLKGHWTLMFFGFTQCPRICPTTMSALRDMYQQLSLTKSNTPIPQIVFVSIDPEHDTIKVINDYVTSFNSHFIGAKTTPENTSTIENQFHITATKIKSSVNGVVHDIINHSSEILLINPDAKIQAYLAYPHQAKVLIIDYNAILAKQLKPLKSQKTTKE
jgi:protein SCO1/2